MPLRHALARKLINKIQHTEHLTHYTCALHKSQLLEIEGAEFCPCHARRYWQIDKMEESIHRLLIDHQPVTSWFLWYMYSSVYAPWFPKASVDCWTSHSQSSAAWTRFNVAQYDGELRGATSGTRYWKDGRVVRTREAGWPWLWLQQSRGTQGQTGACDG